MIRQARPVAALLMAVAIVAVMSAGCGGSPPAIHYYVLELTPRADTGSVPAAGRGWTIGVRPFQVDAPYDQDRIVYRVRDRPSVVGFYAYHRWAVPLSRMLQPAVATGLDGAEGVRLIEPAVNGRDYDAYVVGRVLKLEEVDHSGGQDVVVRVKLGLRSADGTELWSEVLDARDTIETQDVGEIVERMRVVVGQAIEGARESFGRAIME